MQNHFDRSLYSLVIKNKSENVDRWKQCSVTLIFQFTRKTDSLDNNFKNSSISFHVQTLNKTWTVSQDEVIFIYVFGNCYWVYDNWHRSRIRVNLGKTSISGKNFEIRTTNCKTCLIHDTNNVSAIQKNSGIFSKILAVHKKWHKPLKGWKFCRVLNYSLWVTVHCKILICIKHGTCF